MDKITDSDGDYKEVLKNIIDKINEIVDWINSK